MWIGAYLPLRYGFQFFPSQRPKPFHIKLHFKPQDKSNLEARHEWSDKRFIRNAPVEEKRNGTERGSLKLFLDIFKCGIVVVRRWHIVKETLMFVTDSYFLSLPGKVKEGNHLWLDSRQEFRLSAFYLENSL